jgi:hypothetical protein
MAPLLVESMEGKTMNGFLFSCWIVAGQQQESGHNDVRQAPARRMAGGGSSGENARTRYALENLSETVMQREKV